MDPEMTEKKQSILRMHEALKDRKRGNKNKSSKKNSLSPRSELRLYGDQSNQFGLGLGAKLIMVFTRSAV